MFEKNVNDIWQKVEISPLINYALNDVVYNIELNDITELNIDWKWLYGELLPGYYRLSKTVTDFRKVNDYDEKIYQFFTT